MLELSALGLLQREPLHGYKLKQQLELFMGSCMTVNYGAIYPLLKRLEEKGLIVVLAEETGEGGNGRKIYRITDKGRDRWRDKMLEHPKESWVKSRSRFLIKFFFFGDLEPTERVKLLEHRLMVCKLRQEYLDGEHSQNITDDRYQIAAWERAKTMLLLDIEWLAEQLAIETRSAANLELRTLKR